MDFNKEKIREEIYEVYERMLLLAYLNEVNLEELLSEVVSEIKEFQKSKDKNDWIDALDVGLLYFITNKIFSIRYYCYTRVFIPIISLFSSRLAQD